MTFVKITKSIIDTKKYTAIFYDENKKKIKTTQFGASGYEDYTTHGDEERKKRYLLWNKPSFTASYNDYVNKFKLKKM